MSEFAGGYKAKTIKAVISKKLGELFKSADDEKVRKLMQSNTIVTGGCIASMLLGEKVNDFDLYFRDEKTTLAVANYYINKFNKSNNSELKVHLEDNKRIKIVTPSGHRGETAGDVAVLTDGGEIEDVYDDLNEKAQETEGGKQYKPVFVSTNAITLSDRVQIIIRFYGEPNEIHENYDFVHCTNYYDSKNATLTLRQEALEALLAKELRYVGSKYPLCSIIRLRKFIKRGWTVNAGQVLKMVMQLNSMDLLDIAVLEDQLTGVDSAYFCQIIENLKEKHPEKVNAAYLVEIINKMF